jgi:hypothetical protein
MKETAQILGVFLVILFICTGIYIAIHHEHYRVVDSGIENGYIYTIYQHRGDGSKIGCYAQTVRPQDPSKCFNIVTHEPVPFPEHDVE